MENHIEILQKVADRFYDGHFTMMKFTNNWRISFGPTPNSREEISDMPCGKTFEEAFCLAVRQYVDEKL